ncbi:hypothetical protein BDD12DRAFT_988808 [Trichophaea hybrida]|nr:hypothetical protein BDD12DRAFT_988808 [Trichophaea hybrida]
MQLKGSPLKPSRNPTSFESFIPEALLVGLILSASSDLTDSSTVERTPVFWRLQCLLPPLFLAISRHVQLVDDANNMRERQRWSSSGSPSKRPRIVRSPPAYSSRSAYSRAQSSGTRTPIDPHSPRASISTFHLQHLLESLEMDQYDSFGVEELRDGFFDASFYRSSTQQGVDEIVEEQSGLGVNFKKLFKDGIFVQIEDSKFFFTSTFGTRDGILLAKAFLGYFIAYVLCLIPQTQAFLGRYSYWITIAALLNHSGRTTGAQIDGTIGCIVGGALGLGIGCLALEVASVTAASRAGYGGFWQGFWFYQAMITAGLALIFLCLVETDVIARRGGWEHSIVREFAMPWLVGLGICLVINVCLFPETGSRAVANALNNAMCSAVKALELPRAYSLEIHSNMSKQLVSLSDAVRDMRNEITFSSLKPDDIEQLRNILQEVIRHVLEGASIVLNHILTTINRRIMGIKPETRLFAHEYQGSVEPNGPRPEGHGEVAIQIEHDESTDSMSIASGYETPLGIVCNIMAGPARTLVNAMIDMLRCCDNELMRIIDLPDLFDHGEVFDVQNSLRELKSAMTQFDEADMSLIGRRELPSSYSSHSDLVALFLFINPLRQAAGAVDSLGSKVLDISQDPKNKKKRLFLPSYPLKKAIYRTNPQVRHDRGGVSAGYYFRIKGEIDDIMGKIHARAYVPDTLSSKDGKSDEKTTGIGGTDEDALRYGVWKTLHRLQQFESRFAVKVILVITTLSSPAWAESSRVWWSVHESWWAVVAAWLMMHPRVGGNAQDLVTRTIATVLGAVWGGLAYAAGSASDSAGPYVLAVFALVFMVPAVFRFLLSSHPRSGLMACMSFTVVSLSAYNTEGRHNSAEIAWSRGIALVTGVVAAVIVNWIVWPFIARHELRKSLSYMLLNLGIAYRGVVARYIYHDSNYHPTPEDVEISQIQEAKLREYCFRMRELAEMTRHEIRPRGPFDPTPYYDAIDACERFLEHIIEVRQASLYFQPFLYRGSEDATRKMLSPRRDAVASILMNLYVLAGALRSKRPVPRYLPSCAAARKRLLDRMAEVEEEFEEERQVRPRPEKTRRWADVYHYAYAAALTDIVAQVELLERLIKIIMGEMALDAPDWIGHGY